jgi:hypothetical protein
MPGRTAGAVGREAGGLEGGPGEEGAVAGGDHGLHHEDRIQVPPRRLPVPKQELHTDIAGGCKAGLYAVFGLPAAEAALKKKKCHDLRMYYHFIDSNVYQIYIDYTVGNNIEPDKKQPGNGGKRLFCVCKAMKGGKHKR